MKKILFPLLIVLAAAVAVVLFVKPAAAEKDTAVNDCNSPGTCGEEFVPACDERSEKKSFNDYVLETIEAYDRDGSYPYKWVDGYSGVTRDLYYHNEKIANANPDSSRSTYCCGLTFEIYFRSIEKLSDELGLDGDINGMRAGDFEEFLSLWFVREKMGDGPGPALDAFGLGDRIENMKDVRKGDFVQIWRTSGSGHSVIFMNWIISETGDTTGMRYWSTQPGTDGINYNTEYFKAFGGKVDKTHTYYSRGRRPEDFRDF